MVAAVGTSRLARAHGVATRNRATCASLNPTLHGATTIIPGAAQPLATHLHTLHTRRIGHHTPRILRPLGGHLQAGGRVGGIGNRH